jgi:hypothetical protein
LWLFVALLAVVQAAAFPISAAALAVSAMVLAFLYFLTVHVRDTSPTTQLGIVAIAFIVLLAANYRIIPLGLEVNPIQLTPMGLSGSVGLALILVLLIAGVLWLAMRGRGGRRRR